MPSPIAIRLQQKEDVRIVRNRVRENLRRE